MAYMTGCLMVPCFYDQYRKGRDLVSSKSVYHGVPLIQSAKMFKCVAPNDNGKLLLDQTGNFYEFTPSYQMLDAEDKVSIVYR